MTKQLVLDEVRELSKGEIEAVSGAKVIELQLPGQVGVFVNTQTGAWVVTLGGKTRYFYPG